MSRPGKRHDQSRPPRIGHFAGERLMAADLQDDFDFESWKRGMHVRAVHDTWGVALGFDLVPWGDFEGHVNVGPGFAYDACAHEILSSQTTTLTYPRDFGQFGVYTLLCSYGKNNAPEFRWIADGVHFQAGVEIVLGSITLVRDPFSGAIFVLGVSLDERDWARAAIRPHMETGIVRAGDFAWTRLGDQGQPCIYINLQTNRTGFSGTPQYFAWILDNPWLDNKELPPVVSIDQSGPTAVWLQLTFTDTYDKEKVQARLKETTILWFGIEPISGLWPTITGTPNAAFRATEGEQ